MNKIPLLISFSGGRTSAFMTKYLIEKNNANYERVIYVIFANTGKERQETLDFINECDKRWNFNTIWLEADVKHEKNVGTSFKTVNYQTASRNGEPFEEMIKKYGIPNKAFPHCTRELKLSPIKSFMKSIGCYEYETALGYRIDEKHRLKWDRAKKNNEVYPLVTDLRVDNNYIRKFWKNQEFDLQLKDYEGNCDMCWKKSKLKLLTLITENPKLIDWWSKMELKYGTDEEFTFYRNNTSSLDLIELAKKPFIKAIDLKELNDSQMCLFDYDDDMDYELKCNC